MIGSVRTRSRVAALVLALAVATWLAGARPATAQTPPAWITQIQTVIGDRPFSVAVGNDGEYWFKDDASVLRPPASNEKLLLSMALFERYGTSLTIPTRLLTGGDVVDGVLRGDLWLVGRGDPELDRQQMSILADRLQAAGIRRIRGRVLGSTGPFARDWWATGWRDYFPGTYIALPTALVYHGNRDSAGRAVTDPERRAALALVGQLEARSITVRDGVGTGTPPPGLRRLTWIDSAPMVDVVRRMNVRSRNFWSEVLAKRLGLDATGKATIASGAAAVCAFAAAHGQSFTCHDGSGLSYANRASALGIVQLLWYADSRPWGEPLRSTLPGGGQGTLEDRLLTVKLRAKTGTLSDVSALSGWVWSTASLEWIEFSIMSSGFDDRAAKSIEDQIVKILSAGASDPTPVG